MFHCKYNGLYQIWVIFQELNVNTPKAPNFGSRVDSHPKHCFWDEIHPTARSATCESLLANQSVAPLNHRGWFRYGHHIWGQLMKFTTSFSLNLIGMILSFCSNYLKAFRLILLQTFLTQLKRAKGKKLASIIFFTFCHENYHIYRKHGAILW